MRRVRRLSCIFFAFDLNYAYEQFYPKNQMAARRAGRVRPYNIRSEYGAERYARIRHSAPRGILHSSAVRGIRAVAAVRVRARRGAGACGAFLHDMRRRVYDTARRFLSPLARLLFCGAAYILRAHTHIPQFN